MMPWPSQDGCHRLDGGTVELLSQTKLEVDYLQVFWSVGFRTLTLALEHKLSTLVLLLANAVALFVSTFASLVWQIYNQRVSFRQESLSKGFNS